MRSPQAEEQTRTEPADSNGPLGASIITEASALRALAPEWNELLESSEANSIFLTWEWIDAWLQSVRPNAKLFIVALRDSDGRLMAIAPFYLVTMRLLRLIRFSCLRVLGDTDSGAEYPDIPIRRGFEEPCISRLASILLDHCRAWDCLWLPATATWKGTLARLKRLSTVAGLYFHERAYPCSTVPLPPSAEEYRRSLPPKARANLKTDENEWRSARGKRFISCRRREELPGLLDALFELHTRRWMTVGETGCFQPSSRMVAFYRAFAPAALARGWLRLFGLEQDGMLRAVQYGYAYGGSFLALQEGFDPGAAPGAGNVLRSHAFQRCIEEGLREYDFLAGFTDHKRRWGAKLREGHDVFLGRKCLKTALLFSQEVWPTGRYLVEDAPENVAEPA